MIENEEQLRQTKEALEHLELGLASLKRDILPHSKARFALMAEGVVYDIQRLRNEIDEYIGLCSAVSEQADFWIRLEGPEIEIGDAPTSVVTAILDIVRLGVQSIAELLERGSIRARRSAGLKQACDLRIVAWLPGSLQVGLRLPISEPVPHQERLGMQVEYALKLYLKTVEWAGSDGEVFQLEEEIPDTDQRRLLLNQVSRLIPRPRGDVNLVEFYGKKLSQGPVRLRREARKRVRLAIREAVEEYTIRAEGVLRKIDLDQRRFILRDPDSANETRCSVAPGHEDVLEIAMHALDHRIAVTGRQKKGATQRRRSLQVIQIEVLDAPPGAAAP